jgi:hypothetical protein
METQTPDNKVKVVELGRNRNKSGSRGDGMKRLTEFWNEWFAYPKVPVRRKTSKMPFSQIMAEIPDPLVIPSEGKKPAEETPKVA